MAYSMYSRAISGCLCRRRSDGRHTKSKGNELALWGGMDYRFYVHARVYAPRGHIVLLGNSGAGAFHIPIMAPASRGRTIWRSIVSVPTRYPGKE